MDSQQRRWGRRLNRSDSVYVQVTGCCGNHNETSDSVKFDDFFTVCGKDGF